jgi:hypothetical protein
MAYRWLGSLLLLLWCGPVRADAAAPKVALVVDGGGEHRDELKAALAKALAAEPATTAQRPSETAALQTLRASLDAARVVVVLIEQQGRDRYTVAIHSADESGVAHRYGDASGDGLVKKALELAAALPPLPAPPPPAPTPAPTPVATESANDSEKPPITGAVEPPKQHPTETIYKRHHPWAMLVGGAVSFFLPYFVTVGFAANYASYNANAARVGYIPVAGPFLARQRINDKDLKDGYDPGLLADGIVQTLTFNLLIAGIIYCAVGEKRAETRYGRIQPMFSLSAQEARMGALVTW